MILKEVENHFSRSFSNRIDDIIVFSPLTHEEVREITVRYLERMQQNLASQGKFFTYTAQAEALVEIGFSLKYGARFLKRRIDEQVKIPITLHWKEGSAFFLEPTMAPWRLPGLPEQEGPPGRRESGQRVRQHSSRVDDVKSN